MRTDYVVGFVFDAARQRVVLLKKTHPAWQAGLLNGPGGQVNENETPAEAMSRECAEETGVQVPSTAWRCFATMKFPAGFIWFFDFSANFAVDTARTTTDEEVVAVPLPLTHQVAVVPNCRFLIPLAMTCDAAASGSRLSLPVRLVEVEA
jgi:8-oxo-dGTP diphosphatase